MTSMRRSSCFLSALLIGILLSDLTTAFQERRWIDYDEETTVPPVTTAPVVAYTYASCVIIYAKGIGGYGDAHTTSAETCANVCKNKKFFGLDYGRCYCGHTCYGDMGKVDVSACNSSCPEGKANETCGGDLRRSIYVIGDNTNLECPKPPFTYAGCYETDFDSDYNTTLKNVTIVSVRECASHCKGHRYFGLRNSRCFCGATCYGRLGKADNSACNISCTADTNVQCGGSEQSSIYVYGNSADYECVNVRTTYSGCYKVDTRRFFSFMGAGTLSVTSSVLKCANRCKNYTFIALHNPACICTNESFPKTDSSDCTFPCIEKHKSCGGQSHISIYVTDNSTNDESVNGKYAGCYQDGPNPDFWGTATTSATMSVSECAAKCKKHKFFSLQGGSHCICSSSCYGSLGKVNDTECSIACAGNETEKCGGPSQNAVYVLDRSKSHECPKVKITFAGCFKDSSPRDFWDEATMSATMTVDECASKCKGDKYFALQGGMHCICGDTCYGRLGKEIDSACNIPCAGNGEQICGGVSLNSVYIRDYSRDYLCPELR